jgi:hypothetical protein
MFPRLTTLVCAALCGLAGASPLKAENNASAAQDRILSEARSLFSQILPDLKFEPGKCATSDRWYEYPIPQYLGAKYLGLKILADLVPPSYQPNKPAEVLDADDKMGGSFCGKDEADEMQKAARLQIKWRPEASAGAIEPPSIVVRAPAFQFTFPVFSQNFDRAIVAVVSNHLELTRDDDGAIQRNDHPTAGWAYSYEKRDGRWVLLDREELFHTF